uniref:glutaminase n=1 Tax=Euplotes harpa TaxID=151035 RepID=A0A7S3NAU5_9SPIT|mmetsp:Transcript_25596/g.29399  ORF Transcript_25596/g.29399 Transcript_25596/m.29399 type:complete len:189 (+) Transcript_25596:67-633(+)
MNTFSGKWAFKCGLPAQTSISGATILVVPNTLGVVVWSPPLDKHYNSKKGELFLDEFVRMFKYNDIDHVYGAGIMKKIATKVAFSNSHEKDSVNLLYLAKQGKLRDVRRAIANGLNVNYPDYDHRTPLHIACNYGRFEIVKYLVSHGAKIDVKDNFGNTPIDEAKENNFECIVEYLTRQSCQPTQSGV